MKKTMGDEKSELEAVFRIFSSKDKSWRTFSTVKFGTLDQFLSVLTMAVNTQTENIIDIIEELQARGKKRRKRLNQIKSNQINT